MDDVRAILDRTARGVSRWLGERRPSVPVWLAATAALVLASGLLLVLIRGEGVFTLDTAAIAVRVLTWAVAATTVGLLAATVLLPEPGRGAVRPTVGWLHRGVQPVAWVWLGAAAGEWTLRYVRTPQLIPIPGSEEMEEIPRRLGNTAQFGDFLLSHPQGVAVTVYVAVVAALVVSVKRLRRRAEATRALALAGVAVLALALAGRGVPFLELDGEALLALHLVAALAWIACVLGVLVAAWMLTTRDQGLASRITDRYGAEALRQAADGLSDLAVVAAVTVLVTGVGMGLALVVRDTPLLSFYGLLLAAKAAGLVALLLCGAAHRSVTLKRLKSGRPTAFITLAATEVTVMSLVVVVAAVLANTRPP